MMFHVEHHDFLVLNRFLLYIRKNDTNKKTKHEITAGFCRMFHVKQFNFCFKVVFILNSGIILSEKLIRKFAYHVLCFT